MRVGQVFPREGIHHLYDLQAGVAEIATRSRGTPRVANRLLRRVRDYAQVMADGTIGETEARGLASVLENPLQTPVSIEEERSVSPTLGMDSIRASIIAGLMKVEQAPLTDLQTRATSIQTTISAFGEVKSLAPEAAERAVYELDRGKRYLQDVY